MCVGYITLRFRMSSGDTGKVVQHALIDIYLNAEKKWNSGTPNSKTRRQCDPIYARSCKISSANCPISSFKCSLRYDDCRSFSMRCAGGKIKSHSLDWVMELA